MISLMLNSGRCLVVALGVLLTRAGFASCAEPEPKDLSAQLRNLNSKVLAADINRAGMLTTDARQRLQGANLRENQAWEKLTGRAEWEKFRDVRLKALQASLGEFPPVPRQLKPQTTGTLEGDGYRIEK